jgi:photosystem II stability/assembly factor-like uncharacterized protein
MTGMKIRYYILLLPFTLLSALALASTDTMPLRPETDDWVQQSPLPAARNLTGISWATSTHALASGEAVTLIETFDAGATWRNVDLQGESAEPYYNVLCRDAQNYFVIGNSSGPPNHWRTSDGGTTWQRITQFPLGGSWYHIDFVSPSVGFMGANGANVRTTDGGVTWSLRSAYPSCPVMYGMDFRDTQVGLCGGDRVSTTDGGPGIFKTTDAGATWIRKFFEAADDILWVDNNTALAIVGASIYRWTDAGETWSVISTQISTGLYEMTLLPSGTIVGVSSLGDAWRSSDGGFTWFRTLQGFGLLPGAWNLSFYDDQLGSIVGQGGLVYKTSDGGLTWAMVNSGLGGAEFHDIEMFDDNAGVAVGDYGYFVRTSNGGKHWETGRLQVTGLTLTRTEGLQAVSVVDDNFAVAAGFDGVVYKTFDRGATWESIGYPSLPGDVFLYDVKFITHDLGYVTGFRTDITTNTWRTTDGGANWTLLNLNTGHSIDFVDPDHGWIMNTGTSGFRTTNGGVTWKPMNLPNQGFDSTVAKIDFINQKIGWAVGGFGYAAHSTDGGVT